MFTMAAQSMGYNLRSVNLGVEAVIVSACIVAPVVEDELNLGLPTTCVLFATGEVKCWGHLVYDSGLALIRTAQPLSAGAELSLAGTVVGTVISACGDTALAILPLDLPPQASDPKTIDPPEPQTDESPALGGAFWTIEPLRAGLAR